MSDVKRAILTTLEPQKVNEKTVKKQCKTLRICVPLPESNEDKCPEFNYKDELAAIKKKLKQNSKDSALPVNGADPFDNDDDVRRIALEMEAKYGCGLGLGSKKKRRGRKDDYVDIGAGYDESDSFIDNTDGYDEIIPPNITTARGGFYINCGALEFKTDDEATTEVSSSSSEESDSDDSKSDDPNKRKRPLDTTDEEEDVDSQGSTEVQGDKKKNPDKPNISMQQAIKKKLFSPDKIQVKKMKLAEQQQKLERKSELINSSSDIGNVSDHTDKDSAKENKKPMKMSSVDDAIESVINRADDEMAKSSEKIEDNHFTKTSDDRLAYSSEAESDIIKTDPVKLPENLPTDIVQLIEEIKKVAREYKDGGKVKFFNREVNAMLLNLEYKCKILGRSSRVKVYDHLAPFVRCRKETLIKRAKNLVMVEEQRKLMHTVGKLQTHVDQLMPSLMTVHEKECQKVIQKKFSPEAANNEELKNLKAPRRRFPLSEEVKKMLRDIVSLKKRCFLHEGKKKDDLEALMTTYLKAEILKLWPDGWMSMVVLKKFCSNNALKTPQPKLPDPAVPKHSQKAAPVPSAAPASSSVINFTAGNALTITPVNLTEKPGGAAANSPGGATKVESMIKQTIIKEKSVSEKRPELKENKDNGVIVINSLKSKEEPVIPKSAHCQIIDLTDTSGVSPTVDNGKFPFAKDAPQHAPDPLPKSSENTLKNKYPDINITPASKPQSDIEDVQKVIDSLKALHKLSSPSKKDTAKSSSVSVIALNKNYSNSGSSQGQAGGAAPANERTNFSGSIGFQDEFQKQFINNLKPPPNSSKSTYNRCS